MKVLESKAKVMKCTGRGNGGGGCGATLEVEISDLRYWPGVPGDSWGSSDPAVCFKCPVCGAVTDLTTAEEPQAKRSLKKATSAWIHGGKSYTETVMESEK